MALAESMKNFVNDLKASRRSRHEFVKGNRQVAKNIMSENRQFIQNIRAQNKINAQQTHAFLDSSRKSRMEGYNQLMEGIRGDIARIHQAKEAIRQGAHAMMKELREDNQMAHKYWASLANDDPIGESNTQTTQATQKQASTQTTDANEPPEQLGQETGSAVGQKTKP
jgi:hypothetical protein